MKIMVDIDDAKFEDLWRILSSRYTAYRENPRRAWTHTEKLQHVRNSLSRIADEIVTKDNNT